MLRRILAAIILLPVGAVLIGFAVANRAPITVSFDPFNPHDPARTFTVPLYLLAFGILIAGVVVGGFATWLEQGKKRRARRRIAAELSTLNAELEQLRHRHSIGRTAEVTRAILPSPSAKWPPAA
jgi:uncharacterized integral membrane protein